jgi:hypothetical protein
MYTKYCINCGKEANMWTGHIHTEIGEIVAGWCCIEHSGMGVRARSKNCTSVNERSCSGEYKLSEIVFREPLTTELLLEHIECEKFSDMLNKELSSNHPQNKPKSFWDIFWGNN